MMHRLADCLADWVRSSPNSPAVSDSYAAWTYRQLSDAVDQAAHALMQWGVGPGDRVALVGENSCSLVALILAAGRVDAWAVLENARRAPVEVDAILQASRPRRVIYVLDGSRDALAHAARRNAQDMITPFGRIAISALDSTCDVEPVSIDPREQVAALIYTTGSTGTPKGVMLTHANLLHIGGLMRQLRRLTPADRVYGVLPITHVMGLSSGLIGTLLAGAHVRLIPRFSASECLAALHDDQITVLQGAPAMFGRLIKEPDIGDFPALRFIAVGGAPLDPTLKAQIEARFALVVHNGYGLTEASGSCWTRLECSNADCAVGSPTPGMEIRILDSEDAPVPAGKIGELWVRGPNVAKGYYRAPEQTAQAFSSDGWFNTEDLARVDADGRVHIEGRTKDLIIRSGFNVSPLEVEMALNAHAAVQHCAVLGYPVQGNEEIVAVVETVAREDVQEQDLQRFLAERLSPYKRPGRIIFVASLPVAPNGKVLKQQVRKIIGDIYE